ncbi:MAG TPA: hypothetical protein VJ891_01545, partial [Casimicrobiaceae bacterium]|nr:hypothetical protein [Casimicrobiaceae bacterium]
QCLTKVARKTGAIDQEHFAVLRFSAEQGGQSIIAARIAISIQSGIVVFHGSSDEADLTYSVDLGKLDDEGHAPVARMLSLGGGPPQTHTGSFDINSNTTTLPLDFNAVFASAEKQLEFFYPLLKSATEDFEAYANGQLQAFGITPDQAVSQFYAFAKRGWRGVGGWVGKWIGYGIGGAVGNIVRASLTGAIEASLAGLWNLALIGFMVAMFAFLVVEWLKAMIEAAFGSDMAAQFGSAADDGPVPQPIGSQTPSNDEIDLKQKTKKESGASDK